jgi:4-hydroxybenzoate polyprenyltransferase
VKGARAEGVNMLAVRFGEKSAAVAAAVFYFFSIALTFVT